MLFRRKDSKVVHISIVFVITDLYQSDSLARILQEKWAANILQSILAFVAALGHFNLVLIPQLTVSVAEFKLIFKARLSSVITIDGEALYRQGLMAQHIFDAYAPYLENEPI